MNKESIYRIIGYHGEYTPSVKKALRKLLKEYHPDHYGDDRIFKLINDVKKELEMNRVSFQGDKKEKNTKYSDINYEYCAEMADKCEKELHRLYEELNLKTKEKNEILKKYHDVYKKRMNEINGIDDNSNLRLKKAKKMLIGLIIILLGLFVVAIIKNSILFFIAFGIICLISIIIVYEYFNFLNDLSKKSAKEIKKYEDITKDTKKIARDNESISNEILKIERKIQKIENDLRFYRNLLK